MMDGLACPAPRPDPGDRIRLAHGEGARLTRRLIREVFLPALGNDLLAPLGDGATLPAIDGPLVATTDGSIVSPLFFPGGDIGSLAVHSAVNDLAVSGAEPLYLTVAFVLEEGLEIAVLRRVLASLRSAADAAGVRVVAGDTKVAPRGAVDRLFLSTAGIGRLRPGVALGVERVRPGDAILVSGTLADHGLAVLAARSDLGIDGLVSDSAPLHDLVATLLASGADVRFLRDPTRGGVAAVLHDLTEDGTRDVVVREADLPLSDAVRGASELLGLDPLHVANEGKLVAVVAPESVDVALAALRRHPLGARACRIGDVRAGAGEVLVETALGALRVLDEPSGAPLPRIC